MPEYYCDAQKASIRLQDPLDYDSHDERGDQVVRIVETLYGITVIPEKRWTVFCEKLYVKEIANGVSLGGMWENWTGDLSFIHDLPACKRLIIGYRQALKFSALAGSRIEDLRLDFSGTGSAGEFDLRTLPQLRQCQVPLHPGFMSFADCSKLITLSLRSGELKGVLSLTTLANLEELVCNGVKGMTGVVLNETVRLRALELSHMSGFRSIEPLGCFSEELRVVTLDRVRKLNPEWLRYAHKLECIALRLGPIPTIRFLKSLKRLQVLDLFGSKVLDGDLSLRDSLPQQMDAKSWGCSK